MAFHAELIERVRMYGDLSPGIWRLAADLVKQCANESDRWTRRADDAMRIPQVLDEASSALLAQWLDASFHPG